VAEQFRRRDERALVLEIVMALHSQRILAVGLIPIALNACTQIEAATAQPTSTPPGIGVDLGNSSRIPQVAGLAGEGEGYARTEPGPYPVVHGSMPGMAHGPGMPMAHGSTAGTGMDHGGMPMDHGSMPGMSHGSMVSMPVDQGAMPGMTHGSRAKTDPATGGTVSGMGRGSGSHGVQMAHSGHAHVQGTGTVNSVDAAAHKVNVSHAPIPTIGFPAMTMDFAVAPSVDLNVVKPGTRIKFDMEQSQDGMYVIQSIAPAGGGRQ
jgi:Cu/Ag efflux protein CusF